MDHNPRDRRLRPAWWTVILLAVLASVIAATAVSFTGALNPVVPVTLTSDRAGLVMETGAKVKMRGVEVGRVSRISGGNNPVSLSLDIDPNQIKYIPANVEARIKATTAFGAKYVDLVYPRDPSAQRLAAGAVLTSENVTSEVNTVFQNLVGVLHQIDPQKLNAILSALAEGVRGEGQAIGQAATDANQVLRALNPRTEQIRRNYQAFRGFSDAYGAAAQDILSTVDAASTTAVTIATNASALDALLLGVTGFSDSGIKLLAPNQANLINAVNALQPTTDLLMKYNPELTCTLVGAKWYLDNGGYAQEGGNGRTVVLDAGLLPGKDPYRYPDNLPIVGAKGGPGGSPGCGSLPDVTKNFPVRQLVTNTGFGTAMDIRPNPGIGFPGYADYFPATRAVPEAPSIRYPGGPAPGPIPYPGAPPYGAALYGPDGTPLYPGLPPAPPPGAAPDPGRTPGSEPFVVANPGELLPTPEPPLPTPASPSP